LIGLTAEGKSSRRPLRSGQVDEILAWEQRKETERDAKFVELGRYLRVARAGQYLQLVDLKQENNLKKVCSTKGLGLA
jgi:hypothetical protein